MIVCPATRIVVAVTFEMVTIIICPIERFILRAEVAGPYLWIVLMCSSNGLLLASVGYGIGIPWQLDEYTHPFLCLLRCSALVYLFGQLRISHLYFPLFTRRLYANWYRACSIFSSVICPKVCCSSTSPSIVCW